MKWSQSMLGSLLLLIVVLAGCAGDVAEQGEIQKFSEVLSDILPTAKKQENEWRNNLLAKASGTANSLSEITVGTPTQIKAAKAKQDAIKTELSAKVAEARKPLDEAEAKRDALTKPDPRGYYYPASSYQMKRCGSDGCGGICEEPVIQTKSATAIGAPVGTGLSRRECAQMVVAGTVARALVAKMLPVTKRAYASIMKPLRLNVSPTVAQTYRIR